MTTKVGSSVLGASLTLVTPVLGTPTSGTLTNCTGYTYANLSGTTPTWNQNTTGTASNITGTLAVSQGGSGANATTGSGNNVLSTSPTLVTPNLGTPTTLVGTNITGTAASLTVGNATTATTAASCSGNATTATNPQSGGSFITSSNIGSQSVSFASSATNATNATNATTASNLNGTWAQMPAGTTTNFYQAAAPTGWVQRTDLNDFMLYIVSGAGGYAGGSNSPTIMDVVPYHTHGFTTGNVSADHVHYDSGHIHQSFMKNNITGGTTAGGDPWNLGTTYVNTTTGYASIGGASANHTHSGGTDGGSSQTNWAPRYLANIMCYKS